MCLQIFLKGSNWTGWTERQRKVVPKRRGIRVKSSSTSIGLDPRDWQTIIIVWSSGNSAAALNGLQSCLASVQSWMSTNKLKLNSDKTEFLLIGNERQRRKYLSMFPIELLGAKSYPAKSARNLGVIFDKNFNFRSHISAICSSCTYHIRDLRRIRPHLDLESTKLLANALVSSRLDYCNSLLSGIAATDFPKLQRVLNCLARVVTKSPPFTPQCSTAALPSLTTSKT